MTIKTNLYGEKIDKALQEIQDGIKMAQKFEQEPVRAVPRYEPEAPKLATREQILEYLAWRRTTLETHAELCNAGHIKDAIQKQIALLDSIIGDLNADAVPRVDPGF